MGRFLRHREVIPAFLVIVAIAGGGIASPYFWDLRYLLNESSLYVEGWLLALGMTLVIVSGQIDLSVASMLALVAGIVAKLLGSGWPPLLALASGIVVGGLLGALNGALISRLKLPSFVVTLATMAVYRGVAQVMLGSASQKVPESLVGIDMKYVPGTPIPVPLVIFAFFAVLTGLVLHRTVFGRWVFSLGTNSRAAYYSGIPTGAVTVLVFTISGVFAGIGGLMIDSRLGVARFDHATGLELDVITAVVLGGASITGGTGSILGTVLALLLVGLIRTGMGVANVTAEYQLAAIGGLLVVAVLAGNASQRLAARHSSRIRTPS